MKGIDRTAAGGAPVAIVGIGCRFPGGIKDPATFWRLLVDGVDAIGEIPSSRIDIGRYFDPNPAVPGRMMSRWGGYLDHIESFDADFFGISPREAQYVDPQQRVLLETAYEALEDAGQDIRALEGSRTAIFVGQWTSDFESRLFADPEGVDFAMTIGSGRYASSGRLSHAFGFRGPSLTIDCACSSSLASVHLAVQSVRSGECELALAGGVNIILQPQITIGYSQSRMMAADGRCKFGDVSGDGYVRSEGAGLVVLKPLAQALRDADRIYAVIRGSAVNNDGRSSGVLGRPSRIGHEEMLRAAYRDAGIAPARVGYIEAHGTGTRAGDPVELAALGAVLGADRSAEAACFVGSVKTNIGHTEGAAGIAGLIKASLALHHGAIPPSLHFVNPNPGVPWNDLPMRIPTKSVEWPANDGWRVAGVNSFGISGTNAHVVLEEAPIQPQLAGADAPAGMDGEPALLVVSARSDGALRELASRYADTLESDAAPALHDLCRSASISRPSLEQRAVFAAADRASMADALRRFREGDAPAAQGAVYGSARPKTAFVFPGQGGQWLGMGTQLLAREPVFREALMRCDEAARPHIDWSILAQLGARPGDPQYRLDQIDVIQPVLVAMAIAYAALWRSLGVEPDVVIGHSMGEVGAAHVAGVLDLDQAMQIICRRSALMRSASGQGAMALVELPWQDLQARLAGRDGSVSAAVSNSPRSSVVSGDPAGVLAFLADMEREGIFCRAVNVDVASHSPQMDAIAAALEAELAGLTSAAASIPLYSTVFARAARADEHGPAYWAANLRRPVRFGETVAALVADGVSTFIELGPHPVLLPSIEQTAQSLDRQIRAVACGRREESDRAVLLAAVGDLWTMGCPIDWRAVWRHGGPGVGLPLYPWQRERHWAKAAALRNDAGRSARIEPLEAREREWLHKPAWVATAPAADAQKMPGARNHWLLVAEHSDDVAAFSAAFASRGWLARFIPMADLAASLAADAGRVSGIVLLASTTSVDRPFDPILLLQSVLAGLRAAADAGQGGARPRLWLATRGGQGVASHASHAGARVDVLQGAMWGAGRVIAEEHPELWGGMVDLDPTSARDCSARQLVAEVTGVEPGSQVAYRQESRFVLRMQPAEPGPDETTGLPWRADAAYLITGGLGGIGLHIAAALVELGVRRLVLMGRSTMPPRSAWHDVDAASRTGLQVAAIRALEAKGASVHLMQADVSDEADLGRALREYERDAWPAIRGVVHAAALTANQLSHGMDRATFERVFAPKARGALLLDRLLPDLEVFILFSSISASLGVAGMANYAAANVALDALAADRRSRGLHALSIQWGAWRDTGIHSGEGAAQKAEELERQGISEIPPEQGVKVFAAIQASEEPVVAVMPVDFAVLHTARSGRDRSLFEGRMPSPAAGHAAEGGLARLLEQAATPADRRLLLLPLVKESVAGVLKLAPSRLDSRRALGTMGLTSLMAMELRNRLETLVSRPLSATLAWNYPTVDALVAFLAEGTAPDPKPVAPAAPDMATAEAVGLLMDLSDDDAAELLRRR